MVLFFLMLLFKSFTVVYGGSDLFVPDVFPGALNQMKSELLKLQADYSEHQTNELKVKIQKQTQKISTYIQEHSIFNKILERATSNIEASQETQKKYPISVKTRTQPPRSQEVQILTDPAEVFSYLENNSIGVDVLTQLCTRNETPEVVDTYIRIFFRNFRRTERLYLAIDPQSKKLLGFMGTSSLLFRVGGIQHKSDLIAMVCTDKDFKGIGSHFLNLAENSKSALLYLNSGAPAESFYATNGYSLFSKEKDNFHMAKLLENGERHFSRDLDRIAHQRFTAPSYQSLPPHRQTRVLTSFFHKLLVPQKPGEKPTPGLFQDPALENHTIFQKHFMELKKNPDLLPEFTEFLAEVAQDCPYQGEDFHLIPSLIEMSSFFKNENLARNLQELVKECFEENVQWDEFAFEKIKTFLDSPNLLYFRGALKQMIRLLPQKLEDFPYYFEAVQKHSSQQNPWIEEERALSEIAEKVFKKSILNEENEFVYQTILIQRDSKWTQLRQMAEQKFKADFKNIGRGKCRWGVFLTRNKSYFPEEFRIFLKECPAEAIDRPSKRKWEVVPNACDDPEILPSIEEKSSPASKAIRALIQKNAN